MNPYDTPDLYDVIILGTARSPGVVKITGHDRDEEWDIKAAKGQDGASSTLNGKPLAQFQCEFYLVVDYENDVDEIAEWTKFQRVIESTTNGPKPVALTILHPDLARQGIVEVCNGGIGGMVHDGRGGAKVIVKFNEHRPPKPKAPTNAQTRGSAATTGSAVPAKPDPNAEAKAELARLLEVAKRP